MSLAKAPENLPQESGRLREVWLERLGDLVDRVECWSRELGWVTQRTDKRMRDPQIGTYLAPVLILQKGTTPVLLEPVTHAAPGAEGVVDLYLMPSYDDVASLYFSDQEWKLHHLYHGKTMAETTRNDESRPLTKDMLNTVLEELRADAA